MSCPTCGRLSWFGVSMVMHSGVPSGLHSTYASIYRKIQTVSPVRHVWSSFKFRHRHNISRKESVTVVDAWGTCGDHERCSGWRYRVMRRNTFSRTSRKNEALLDHLDELGATVQTTPATTLTKITPFYRKGSNILPLPCGTFNPPSHTSTVRVSDRTPLEFGG